jgi:HK97 family phage major capsid protein
MTDLELKGVHDQIALEQKKQFDAVEALKTAHASEVDKLNKKVEKSEERIVKLSEQADGLALQLKDNAKFSKKVDPWADMKKKMTDKSTIENLKGGGQVNMEVKLVGDMTEYTNLSDSSLANAVVIPFREAGVYAAPDRPITLLDLIQTGPCNSSRVTWVERSARYEMGVADNFTNAAAAVAEAAIFLQSDYTWIQRSAIMEKIATYVKVTNEALEDWDQCLDAIRGELLPLTERAVESAVFSGTGATPQIQGIFDSTDIAHAYELTTEITGVVTPNSLDVILAMAAQIRSYKFGGPLTVLVNPIDYALMMLPKNTQGIYLLPPFITADRTVIAGVRVVSSFLATAGTFYMGDFSKDKLYFARGIEIKIWDQNSDDPIHDLKTITATVRLANRIHVPDYYAFCYDAAADVVTAIQ